LMIFFVLSSRGASGEHNEADFEPI